MNRTATIISEINLLKNKITAEEKQRSDKDTELSNRLNIESTQRFDADEALSVRINNVVSNIVDESGYRIAADKEIRKDLDTEIQERKQNDVKLTNDLDRLNHKFSSVTNLPPRIDDLDRLLQTEIQERKEVEGEHDTQIQKLHAAISSIPSTIDDKIKKLIDGAPTAFDTLKEIADWIQANPNQTSQIVDRLNYLNQSMEQERNERIQGIRNVESKVQNIEVNQLPKINNDVDSIRSYTRDNSDKIDYFSNQFRHDISELKSMVYKVDDLKDLALRNRDIIERILHKIGGI